MVAKVRREIVTSHYDSGCQYLELCISTTYRAALAANPDCTIRTFPGADHGLYRSRTGSMQETGRYWADGTVRPADGYVDTIIAWLGERGFTA